MEERAGHNINLWLHKFMPRDKTDTLETSDKKMTIELIKIMYI